MPAPSFARMMVKFCQQRAATVLSPRTTERLQAWVVDLIAARLPPPRMGRDYDWHEIADACGIDVEELRRAARVIAPGLDALAREVSQKGKPRASARKRSTPVRNPSSRSSEVSALVSVSAVPVDASSSPSRRRGPRPKAIVDFPENDGKSWTDPASFSDALDLHMRRHGDTASHLARALEAGTRSVDATTLSMWRRGVKIPRTSRSLAALERIERRYRLPPGYFQSKLPNTDRCASAGTIVGISRAEQRRLAWHLPADFDRRTFKEREEILEQIRVTPGHILRL